MLSFILLIAWLRREGSPEDQDRGHLPGVYIATIARLGVHARATMWINSPGAEGGLRDRGGARARGGGTASS